MIICTYNRAILLAEVLQTVCEQTLARTAYEVIVVDNRSTDDTSLVCYIFAMRYPNVRVYFEEKQGFSYARNRSWQEAKGDYVISWLVLIGQSAIIGALCLVDGCVLALVRCRARFPYFQNYWYESTLHHVKTLGKLYQQLAKKMQHSQSGQGYVREALQ